MSMEESHEDDKSGMLVVIGSSAGGIEALVTLLGPLGVDFPAPIVLAQHLAPDRVSSLAAVLERRCTLPVTTVTGPTPLTPSRIFVVPSNSHVVIRDNNVDLDGDHAVRPRPSVDLLLQTAAEAWGDRVIAVILTGNGQDGAVGAVEVKKAGGTVVIQNPATADHPSMPRALPPTAVDHMVDLESMGALLLALVTRPQGDLSSLPSDDSLTAILGTVRQQTGIDFHPYKPTTLFRRIARRMAVTQQASLADYQRYLTAHTGEVAELAMSFLIKVTEFFRDTQAFAYLRSEILPRLIDRGRADGKVLRLWSAGCATGEEPYSLALLLAGLLDAELPNWNIKIFATDLDEGAIHFARRGLYPANLLRNLPEGYLERFFQPADSGLQIAKNLRQMVIFGQQDIVGSVPFPRIDMIVCRNLLIYFKPELQQRVLDRFAYSLHQVDGFLFLGKAETARPSTVSYELVDNRWKVYRASAAPAGLHPRMLVSSPGPLYTTNRTGAPRRGLVAEGMPVGMEPRHSDEEGLSLRRLSELAFRLMPLGVAVIDRSYRIVTLNPAARRLFGIREMAYDQDFLHTVRSLPYAPVRAAVDGAFRDRNAVTLADLEMEITPADGEARFLTMVIAPLQVETGGADTVMVSVTDVTEAVLTRRQLAAIQGEHTRLVRELTETNKRLSETNKDFQDANEELQATNEEMMLTQEELQATNEELEATNEELQATNEELETNNEELQATNEELEATNDELSARTTELQDITRTLTTERVRLTEIVALAPVPILVARGPSLLVETFNPRYLRLVTDRDALGRPLEEFFRGSAMASLAGLACEAYWQDAVRRSPPLRPPSPSGAEPSAEAYVHTIVPLHDGTRGVDGVLIYAESATDLVTPTGAPPGEAQPSAG